MIKKIICPTDFSHAANSALEYAGKLAQIFNAEVVLVNVEKGVPVEDAVSLGESVVERTERNAGPSFEKLKEMAIEVKSTFNIPSSYEVDMTAKSLSKAIASHGKSNSMIVMGTNGVDGLAQFLFGTNTYKVIKAAECPVLVVPENCSFEAYKNITFAFTYEADEFLPMISFFEFAKFFKARITLLQVNKEDTQTSRDIFLEAKRVVESYFDAAEDSNFRRIFSEDAAEAIDDFMRNNPADLLIVATRHRNAVERLFRKTSFLERLTATTIRPMLVFQS